MKGALALMAILVAGYAARTWFQNRLTAAGASPTCIDVLGHTTSEQDGATYIIGSVKNGCDRSFSNLTVVFKVDPQSGPMGNLPEGFAQAYVRDIKPGDIRDFKSALPVPREATFRLNGINAF